MVSSYFQRTHKTGTVSVCGEGAGSEPQEHNFTADNMFFFPLCPAARHADFCVGCLTFLVLCKCYLLFFHSRCWAPKCSSHHACQEAIEMKIAVTQAIITDAPSPGGNLHVSLSTPTLSEALQAQVVSRHGSTAHLWCGSRAWHHYYWRQRSGNGNSCEPSDPQFFDFCQNQSKTFSCFIFIFVIFQVLTYYRTYYSHFQVHNSLLGYY